MKYAACIETLYTDLPFIERITKAKDDGFRAIDLWTLGGKDIESIRRKCLENKIEVASFTGIFENQLFTYFERSGE